MTTRPVIHYATVASLRMLAQRLHGQGAVADAQSLATAIADVVEATGSPALYASTFWGGCPLCGDCEAVLSVGGRRYACCHEHRVYWYLGTNFLACAETPAHAEPQLILTSYTEIPTKTAFPQDICVCCGYFIEHAPWCVRSAPKRW